MDGGLNSQPNAPVQLNLQTLVSAIQLAVQAQNLIAEQIGNLEDTQAASGTSFSSFATSFLAAFTTAFPPPLSGSAVFNPPSISSGTSSSTTIAVAGAALGNYVQASFSLDLQGLTVDAYVSAANTVTVVFSNLTGSPVDLGSGTLKVRVTNT